MTPEPEQSGPAAAGAAGSRPAGSKAASKPRAGVPVWRTGKPDAVLAAAVDVARAAVEGIAPAWQIGQHLGAKTEGDRLVTHLFESKLPGYQGWQWYAVLTRNSRSKVVTVNELGLLPSEDSILAPEWVPWAERVRPEDEQGDEDAAAEPLNRAAGQPAPGKPDARTDDAGEDEDAVENAGEDEDAVENADEDEDAVENADEDEDTAENADADEDERSAYGTGAD